MQDKNHQRSKDLRQPVVFLILDVQERHILYEICNQCVDRIFVYLLQVCCQL